MVQQNRKDILRLKTRNPEFVAIPVFNAPFLAIVLMAACWGADGKLAAH